jgi:hypothetical protein
VFPLPAVAQQTALLEGSSPQATLEGDRVTVAAPFAPGPTIVQFAYTIPFGSDEATLTQRLPAALAQLSVVVQKAGDMRLSSAQVAQQRDMQAEGQTYILGQGPPLPAGTDVTFTLSGLPHTPVWPRNVALVRAGLILAAGAYGASRGAAAAGASAERTRLQAERERLFAELTELEAANGRGELDPQRFTTRRRELIVALVRVFAALDESVAA